MGGPREAPPQGCPKNCVFEAEIWPFPCPNFAFLRPQFPNPCPDIVFLRDFGGQVPITLSSYQIKKASMSMSGTFHLASCHPFASFLTRAQPASRSI
jgi:hypothetical protein